MQKYYYRYVPADADAYGDDVARKLRLVSGVTVEPGLGDYTVAWTEYHVAAIVIEAILHDAVDREQAGSIQYRYTPYLGNGKEGTATWEPMERKI